jgi:hypothetical protein
MAQRCLNLGQAGSALDGMRTVCVPQPVRRYVSIDAGLLCRTFHHGMDGALGKPAATFTACEYRIIGAGVAAER